MMALPGRPVRTDHPSCMMWGQSCTPTWSCETCSSLLRNWRPPRPCTHRLEICCTRLLRAQTRVLQRYQTDLSRRVTSDGETGILSRTRMPPFPYPRAAVETLRGLQGLFSGSGQSFCVLLSSIIKCKIPVAGTSTGEQGAENPGSMGLIQGSALPAAAGSSGSRLPHVTLPRARSQHHRRVCSQATSCQSRE